MAGRLSTEQLSKNGKFIVTDIAKRREMGREWVCFSQTTFPISQVLALGCLLRQYCEPLTHLCERALVGMGKLWSSKSGWTHQAQPAWQINV